MFENPVWYAHATYDDGTEIYREFPYIEGDNYRAECNRQQTLEEWCIENHDGCNWYSVGVTEGLD